MNGSLRALLTSILELGSSFGVVDSAKVGCGLMAACGFVTGAVSFSVFVGVVAPVRLRGRGPMVVGEASTEDIRLMVGCP